MRLSLYKKIGYTLVVKQTSLIILFGSRATGAAGKKSDVDIAILDTHQLSLKEKSAYAETASKEIGASEDDIDIVDLWTASPLLQHEIARHGKLLHGDEFLFERFKILAWKRYLDTAKFRKMREKTLHANV